MEALDLSELGDIRNPSENMLSMLKSMGCHKELLEAAQQDFRPWIKQFRKQLPKLKQQDVDYLFSGFISGAMVLLTQDSQIRMWAQRRKRAEDASNR